MASLTNRLDTKERVRLLRALSTLRTMQPAINEPIVQWLNALLAEQDQKNRSAEGPDLFRGQGKAVLLSSIVEVMDRSTELLRDMDSKS